MIISQIVDPHVETYIRSLLADNVDLLNALEIYAQEAHVPIVHPEVAQHLKVLMHLTQPKRILEIGTAIGYSATLMAEAIKEGEIDTIELNEGMVQKASETFKLLKASGNKVKIRLHEGDAVSVLQNLKGPYDFIFIDAAKGHYQTFFDLCKPMLSQGGVVVSDNVLYKGMVATNLYLIRRKITIVKRMRKYLKYISSQPDLETSILPIGDGLAITYLKEANAK